MVKAVKRSVAQAYPLHACHQPGIVVVIGVVFHLQRALFEGTLHRRSTVSAAGSQDISGHQPVHRPGSHQQLDIQDTGLRVEGEAFFALAHDFENQLHAGAHRVVSDNQMVAVLDKPFNRLGGGHHLFDGFGHFTVLFGKPFSLL
jgi:hypothetical protein